MGNLPSAAKSAGWLWLILAVVFLAKGVLLVYLDLSAPESEDPTGFGLTIGILYLLVSLPFFFCGTALVRRWQSAVLWFVCPAILLVFVWRMLL